MRDLQLIGNPLNECLDFIEHEVNITQILSCLCVCLELHHNTQPLDQELLHIICKKYPIILTIEDGCIKGGMGSAIIEFCNDFNYNNKIIQFGVPDKFIEHGSQAQQRKECGYDKNTVLNKILELL